MDTAKVRVSRDMIILLGFILVLLSLIRKWRDIILSQLRLYWVPLAVIAVHFSSAFSTRKLRFSRSCASLRAVIHFLVYAAYFISETLYSRCELSNLMAQFFDLFTIFVSLVGE